MSELGLTRYLELKHKGLTLFSESVEVVPKTIVVEMGVDLIKDPPFPSLTLFIFPEGPWMCPCLFWWCSDFSSVCAKCSASYVCLSPGPEAKETKVKGACKCTWSYSSGEKGCHLLCKYSYALQAQPQLGGQDSQTVNWCEGVFEGIDDGGSYAVVTFAL